ncbi:NACHT domain- and WD repeat-containing protein 1 [Cimex lectularius]|uniref:NWD1/2-like winged helix-turn-helix domain-containing protein n=1 Tax=Cimex lectularius TaxID=79782 RepID=A0A8I6RYN7_CIMLE|nr:NACHT domain- and WD repeat-containing protein 1 [Cimex lectularius]
MINDEVVEEVLRGELQAAKWAIPRTLKIFISSARDEFIEERRILLENVGPDLQTHYDSTGLEVELVDMHYGTENDPLSHPFQYEDLIQEIRECHKISRGCFYLCLVGDEVTESPLPVLLTEDEHVQLTGKARDMGIDPAPVNSCYRPVPGYGYRLQNTSEEEMKSALEVLKPAARKLKSQGVETNRQLMNSSVEHQFNVAAELSTEHMVAVIRSFEDCPSPLDNPEMEAFKISIAENLPEDNIIKLTVPWANEGKLDPDCSKHDTYLTIFQETVYSRLQDMINKNIEEKPEINARNKAIQEVFKEALIHLALSKQILDEVVEVTKLKGTIDHVKSLMMNAPSRHGPIILLGSHGSGKTSVLTRIYSECEEWFGNKVLRVLRFSGATPRSSYNLELVRMICEQLLLLFQPAGPCIPKDASFDPLYINNWFQTLVRRFDEESSDRTLVILIDDLHRLNPLDSDIVAALSWLPINLPKNVHIVVTSVLTPDVLKLTPVQRERFKSSDCLFELPSVKGDLEKDIEEKLERLEAEFGSEAISRLGAFLTATEFGLTEVELLELLMPTSSDNGPLLLSDGFFNFSTFCTVKRKIIAESLIFEKFMSGRILLCWKYEMNGKVARKRYLQSQDLTRSIHAEIANLFFSAFSNQDEQLEESDHSAEGEKQTPFQSHLHVTDVTYSLRHVEESWIHLLKAGDSSRLKQMTFCNFDFLLAAVRTISVSYLRSILEHVRCYLLDRDIELVYYTVRKSSDVLTRDTLQLGAQVICWLRPVAETSGQLMSRMIMSAMAWCDGFTDPLLVPLNSWLLPPLPLQIKSVVCPNGVRLIEPTPTAQHVVLIPNNGDPQIWHVMSNALVHTFKGHSGRVLCLAITKQSQYLITGSEDTSIIVWDLKTLEIKLRLFEHIAPVLSVTPALNNTLLVSGGEDSRIIVSSLVTGEVVVKIDHHRGPVTAVNVTLQGDILVSGSSDKSVCLWELETFTLLNTIVVASPVSMLSITDDSVFLLVACEDNQLYLHTLATGTEIHTLRGHKAKVVSITLAGDNQRAVAGGADGRVYVFDMHSGCLVRTISTSHNGEVTGVKVTNNDDFLITAGGNRITFWSFRKEDGVGVDDAVQPMSGKAQNQAQRLHTAPITCCDISRDGITSVTGSMDCLVNVWQLNTHELHSTMEGHTGTVTCVAISPNGIFAISGSEDKTARVWGLTLGMVATVFKGHQATVTAVAVLADSRRVVSSDRQNVFTVWLADNATLLHTALGPTTYMAISNDMKYVVSGDGDNTVRIWPATPHRDDERFNVSHSEEITCFVITIDSLHVITGSRDMSLKVWQVAGGKLTQVLVGHTDQVTCVAVAIENKTIVVSGSKDSNLIVWDMITGDDLHLLQGHLGYVTCVKLAGDGSIAVSGSEDKRIIVWDTKKGVPLTSLQLHQPILGFVMSTDATRVAVHLLESKHLPIICLHNTPATYVKMPVYVAPAKEIEDLRPNAPKRPMRRLLKKEVSLDTYTWQRKYGHLTSSIMKSAVDERFKRRFSVSASMEEISKIPQKENLGSQQGLGPEQAALAQSQHFDQLEALWNKRSPPRSRRMFQSLSKQNSRSSRKDSTDNDDQPSPVEEVADFIGD